MWLNMNGVTIERQRLIMIIEWVYILVKCSNVFPSISVSIYFCLCLSLPLLSATGIFSVASIREAAANMWESASPDLRKDYGREHFDRQMKMMQSYANSGVSMRKTGRSLIRL